MGVRPGAQQDSCVLLHECPLDIWHLASSFKFTPGSTVEPLLWGTLEAIKKKVALICHLHLLRSHRMAHPVHNALQGAVMVSQGPPRKVIEVAENPSIKMRKATDNP